MITLWLCYFLGYVLHVLKRANLSASSPISQGTRMREFLARNWTVILIRGAANTGFFMVWLDPGGYLDRVLPKIGLGSLVGVFPTPTKATYFFAAVAGAFGFLLDSLADWAIAKWAPQFQKELPAISDN